MLVHTHTIYYVLNSIYNHQSQGVRPGNTAPYTQCYLILVG